MSGSPKVLVLGGGYAGLLAASRLSRSRRPLEITLVDRRASFEQRIRYHETLAGAIPKALDYAKVLARRGVSFCQGDVLALDAEAQTVTIAQGHERVSLSYDYVIITLGSQAIGAQLHGIKGASSAASLLSLGHGQAQSQRLVELAADQAHVAIIGGGLTALECATEIKERFPALQVTLACRSDLSSDWSLKGAQHLRNVLQRMEIAILEHCAIAKIQDKKLVTVDGDCIGFDHCFWAAGFTPSKLGQQAGFPTDSSGRVLVNECLQVRGHERIFVAGDLASVYAGQIKPLRMGCVTAMPQGAQAGDNVRRLLNQQSMVPFRFGYFFRCVSLGRHEGLIQYVRHDDKPLERINRGHLAAWIKEAICRMTFVAIKWELKTGLPLYMWPKPKASDTQASSPISSKDMHL